MDRRDETGQTRAAGAGVSPRARNRSRRGPSRTSKPPAERFMKTRSLAASLLLHAAAVLVLFTLAPPPPVPKPPARSTYVALIAPLSPAPALVHPRPKIPPPEPR